MTTIGIILITAAIAYAWGHGNGTSRSAMEVEAARRRGWEDGYTQGWEHGRDAERSLAPGARRFYGQRTGAN